MIKLDSIPKAEAARYMGVRGEPDERVAALLDEGEKLVLEAVRPRYVYRILPLVDTPEGLLAEGTGLVLAGEDVRRHLSGCGRAAFFAATLSDEADKLVRRAAVRDMALSVAVDALCSAAIERVCDLAEEEIFAAAEAPYRTWRFSPGYGDLPLETQGRLLTALNAQRRIGLTLTKELLLIPSKSVTAIVGISDKPVAKGKKGCAACSMSDRCDFRRRGAVCK